MAFRQTAFNPSQSQQFHYTQTPNQRQSGPGVNNMEEGLAKEMAKLKMEKERDSKENEKICSENEEIRELLAKIKAAYLNKERASQVAENQYRKQLNLVSFKILYSDSFNP